jgi:hypothetical protein
MPEEVQLARLAAMMIPKISIARSFNAKSAKSAKGAEGNVVSTFWVTRIFSATRCLLSLFSTYFALTAAF